MIKCRFCKEQAKRFMISPVRNFFALCNDCYRITNMVKWQGEITEEKYLNYQIFK